MSDNKKWKIRLQEIRDIFFRMRLELKIKMSILSKYLDISKSTLYRWLKEGNKKPTNPTRIKGNRNIIPTDIHLEIINHIIRNNTLTLEEINKYIENTYNIKISISTTYRFCIYNKITLKKGSLSYIESDINKVGEFIDSIKEENINKYIMMDEASFLLNHNRCYGRSLKGKRAIIKKPGKHIKRYSLLLSINYNNEVKYELHEGSLNSEKFRSFVKKLPNDSTLVLDNASIHHATKSLITLGLSTIKETVCIANSKLKYLPPYTPQLNPVELCFNIIRTYVNKNAPRTFKDLVKCIVISINNLNCKSIIDKVWNL